MGQGSQQQVGGLGGVVRVGDDIVVIEDGRRAAKARQRFAGHHLRVGVQVRHQNIPLHQRLGKLHPRGTKGLVGQVVPAALIQLSAALFQRVQLHQTQRIVQRAEGLALRPLPVGGGHLKKAVPCGKGGKLRPGIRRKPGILGAVEEDELGGFGHREHHLPPLNDAVLHKAGHIGRHVLGGEPVVPVHKGLDAQCAGIRGVGREQVRQVQRTGLVSLGVLQLTANGGAVGHVGHIEQDTLLLAHRIVELGEQAVHRRICLFAVHMPDAEHGGVLGREQGLAAAAARKVKTGENCRKLQKCPSFHVRDSFPHVAAKGKTGTRSAAAACFVGKPPPNPPNFWLFGGISCGEGPKSPKFIFEMPPKNGYSRGAFFS